MITVWEYSLKTEAERLLHCAHQISIGFYRVNNFIVFPYNPRQNGVNIVTFPELPYYKIHGFWKNVKFIDIVNLPIRVSPRLISDTQKLLEDAKLPRPDYSAVKLAWNRAESEVLREIYKVMPAYKNKIKKITIFPTMFGTGSSFNHISKNGEIILYLRQDKGIRTITEAIITSLTRRDIYNELNGLWHESEIITDWLVTKSSIEKVLGKYSTDEGFLPTIKGVRAKQIARLLKESESFYKKLGLPAGGRVFSLNGMIPEIYKKPVENLTAAEKKVLALFIENGDHAVTFDEIGSIIFKSDDEFSLYAIAKTIQRLRNKLEVNGVSGSYIQTLRGRGYLLKN